LKSQKSQQSKNVSRKGVMMNKGIIWRRLEEVNEREGDGGDGGDEDGKMKVEEWVRKDE
jgi:hypothetical protein